MKDDQLRRQCPCLLMGASGSRLQRSKELVLVRRMRPDPFNDLRMRAEWAFKPKHQGVPWKAFCKRYKEKGVPQYFDVPED